MSRSKYGTTFAICDRQTERTSRATDPDHGMTYKCVKGRSGCRVATEADLAWVGQLQAPKSPIGVHLT